MVSRTFVILLSTAPQFLRVSETLANPFFLDKTGERIGSKLPNDLTLIMFLLPARPPERLRDFYDARCTAPHVEAGASITINFPFTCVANREPLQVSESTLSFV